MACNGPFYYGVGGWCNCNCKCCPPCPCYTQIIYSYACGSSSSLYPDAGCDCSQASFLDSDIDFPDFPDFNLDNAVFRLNIDESVSALALQLSTIPICSIPCVLVKVTISYSGCCLYPLGGDVYAAIGDGIITASCVTGCGKDFTVYVNEFDITCSGYPLFDGEIVVIEIIPPADGQCCSCCFVNKEEVLLDQCKSQAFGMTKRNTITGLKKTYLNKDLIIKKIQAKKSLRR